MIVISDIAEMIRFCEQERIKDTTLGLVPTMGYLHSGHLSLVDLARENSDLTLMTIYVNPTQFGPNEDFDQYPRDLERDLHLAEQKGVDIVFTPRDSDMYPNGYQTYVNVEQLTKKLCGTFRPTHFRGVTTIVAKLFNITRPHVAVFGQKDYQQAIVIKKMVHDLNMNIRVLMAPIVREKDGLATSSRNKYLTKDQRKQAVALYKSLQLARQLIEQGEQRTDQIKQSMYKILDTIRDKRIEYIEFVDPETLKDMNRIKPDQPVVVALAVYVGKTRLIDNLIVK